MVIPRDAGKCARSGIGPCEIKGTKLGGIDDIEVEMDGNMTRPCRLEPFDHGLAEVDQLGRCCHAEAPPFNDRQFHRRPAYVTRSGLTGLATLFANSGSPSPNKLPRTIACACGKC